jgi:AcrR family transcriptional regulator
MTALAESNICRSSQGVSERLLPMNLPAAAPPPRKASREHRRQQLIDATIETLARKGYSQTTMTDVAATAGVSHGLVNFHFQTKDKLLTETLLYLADEYTENWQQALAAAPPQPAAQIAALIQADFSERICSTAKLIAWCSFWGEAQNRPMYQENCGANDEAYIAMMEDICRRLISEGGYRVDATRAARVIRVVIEGAWLDLLLMIAPYDRAEAMKTVYLAAASLFPRHFDEDGLIAT